MPQDFQEHTEGSYYDRKIKKNETKEHRTTINNRALGLRRALMATGLGVATLFGFGAASNVLKTENRTHEEINVGNQMTKILEQYPDAQVHVGGDLIIHFKQSGNELFPRVRTDKMVINKPDPNILTGVTSSFYINNAEWNFNPQGTDVEIKNYITVPGDSATSNNPNAKEDWLLVTFAQNNQNTSMGAINLGAQTSEFITKNDSGDEKLLEQFTNSNDLLTFNNTSVISK